MQEASPERVDPDLLWYGGGVLQSVVEMLSLFVPKGTVVVSVKGRSQRSDASYRIDLRTPLPRYSVGGTDKRRVWPRPARLWQEHLQDLDRAAVMGHKSFGKGLVQRASATARRSFAQAHYGAILYPQ